MQYLLSRASRAILERLARERTLCAFDFDGTLAPIVSHPRQAGMSGRTRQLLGRLTALYPCVVISGRARADVLRKLSGAKMTRVIGNHGAESKATSRKSRHRITQWMTALEAELTSLPGVWIEDKGISLAVHYRQARRKGDVRRRILVAAGTLKRVRVFGGKQVVNLVVDTAPNKGDALASERDRLGCTSILYVGDDDNDEDAFRLGGDVVSVRIGRKRNSQARYYLRTETEINTLLERLVLEANARA